MNRNFNLTLTVALCASLLIHGLLVNALVEWHARRLESEIYQPAPVNPAPLREDLLAPGNKPVISEMPPPKPLPGEPAKAVSTPPPEPPAKPNPAKPPSKPRPVKPPPYYVDAFGEHGGTGDAAQSSPGKNPLRGMEFTEDQPYLSRNPNTDWGFNPDTFASRGDAGEGGHNGGGGAGGTSDARPAGHAGAAEGASGAANGAAGQPVDSSADATADAAGTNPDPRAHRTPTKDSSGMAIKFPADAHAVPDATGDGHLAARDRPGSASTDKGTADEHRLASAEPTMLLPKPPDTPTPLGVPRAALPLPLPPPRPRTAPRRPVVIAMGDVPAAATAPIEAERISQPDHHPLHDPNRRQTTRPEPVTRPADLAAVDPRARPTTGPFARDLHSATRPADAVALDLPPTTQRWGAPPATAAFVTDRPLVPTSMPAHPVMMASAADGMVAVESAPAQVKSGPVALSRPAAPAAAPAHAVKRPSPATSPSPAVAIAAHQGGTHDSAAPPGVSGAPGVPGKASASGGLGGNKSDSEYDPASKAADFTFRDGRVVARDGRKVKTVRPHISEAGEFDIESMDHVDCVVAFKIDAGGKVVDVNILRSSGSNLIDQPVYLAAWKWEFEPLRDRDGHAIPDVQIVHFVYH